TSSPSRARAARSGSRATTRTTRPTGAGGSARRPSARTGSSTGSSLPKSALPEEPSSPTVAPKILEAVEVELVDRERRGAERPEQLVRFGGGRVCEARHTGGGKGRQLGLVRPVADADVHAVFVGAGDGEVTPERAGVRGRRLARDRQRRDEQQVGQCAGAEDHVGEPEVGAHEHEDAPPRDRELTDRPPRTHALAFAGIGPHLLV